MTVKGRLSSDTNEHYTPQHIVDLSRAVVGHFDLDPASNHKYAPHVGAHYYYTREQDGLHQPWFGNVWLNPPGGRTQDHTKITKSNSALWWHFLTLHYLAGTIRSGFFLGFSLEQLQTIQMVKGLRAHPLQFPTVFFKRRIQFLGEDLGKGKQPTHSNFLTFLPPREGNSHKELFRKQLSNEGMIVNA